MQINMQVVFILCVVGGEILILPPPPPPFQNTSKYDRSREKMEVSSELLVWYFNQQLSIGRMLNWYYADLCSIMISSEKDRTVSVTTMMLSW